MYFTEKFLCRKSVGSYDVVISYCSAFDIVVLTFIAYSGKCFDILQCVVRVVYFFCCNIVKFMLCAWRLLIFKNIGLRKLFRAISDQLFSVGVAINVVTLLCRLPFGKVAKKGIASK